MRHYIPEYVKAMETLKNVQFESSACNYEYKHSLLKKTRLHVMYMQPAIEVSNSGGNLTSVQAVV
jgi:hypothetical protein